MPTETSSPDENPGTGVTRRVLYLMPNAVPGGAERATMAMLAGHSRQRYEPAALFFSDGPLVEEARKLGIAVHVLPEPLRLRRPMAVARAVSECSRLVEEGQFALVHTCMSYAHLIGGATAGRLGVPAVLYQHGPVGSWMDGAATLLRCDRILVNSDFTAGEQRARNWRDRPTTLAPYGIDTCIQATDRSRLRQQVDDEHGLDPQAPVIGMMARFDPWKGIDVALRAMAPLLRAQRELRFVIVGGQYRHFHPTYGAQLRTLAAAEGIDRQVIFAGYRMDVRPYLARMTVLVHCSLQPEPFGLTIIEAMAAGVPVVAARGGGAGEIVAAGVDGLLHTAGDEVELRESVRRLLEDHGLREAFVKAGLQKVEAKYRPTRMMRVIENVYDEVLAS